MAAVQINAPQLVGDSEGMEALRSLIRAVSDRDCTVLVQGESGTGKELVAQQIHVHSPRRSKPFVAVDCTNLRDTLFESQLFGHTRGAFTGAISDTLGFFRAADGGTLFFDEIAEMDSGIQAKLLRCIQERAVTPLGSVRPVPVNVRIIAATHRDLRSLVRAGRFREDLFYRLNVVCLDVPPLHTRGDDVTQLAEHFLKQLAEIYQEPVKRLAPDAMAMLRSYRWPGNVRELANAIEHAFVLSRDSELSIIDLPETLQPQASQREGHCRVVPLESAERSLIVQALKSTEGNQNLAARLLQIDRRRLYRKVRRYGLEDLTQTKQDSEAG